MAAEQPVRARIRSPLRVAVAAIASVRAELLVSCAMLLGWALVTLALGRIGRPDVVWPFSAGAALLGLCGWRFLLQITRDGLYVLTRGPNG